MQSEPNVYDVAVQENGRMILPADLRRRLGMSKGGRVVIEELDGVVSLTTARERRRRAQAIAEKYARTGGPRVDAFLTEKRIDAEREKLDTGPSGADRT